MRVYVETNFLLEITLEQQEHAACEAILALAETKAIPALVMPAFCFAEPHFALTGKKLRREELSKKLIEEQQEFRRTPGFTLREGAWNTVNADLLRSAKEVDRFREVSARILGAGHTLSLTAEILSAAWSYTKPSPVDLKLPDALVLASVVHDPELGRVPSLFLNRNTKDFDTPAVRALLKSKGCDLIGSFQAGLSRIRSTLEKF